MTARFEIMTENCSFIHEEAVADEDAGIARASAIADDVFGGPGKFTCTCADATYDTHVSKSLILAVSLSHVV